MQTALVVPAPAAVTLAHDMLSCAIMIFFYSDLLRASESKFAWQSVERTCLRQCPTFADVCEYGMQFGHDAGWEPHKQRSYILFSTPSLVRERRLLRRWAHGR